MLLMALITSFQTSKKKEKEGARVELSNGIVIYTRRMGNPEYEKLQRNLLRPWQKRIRRGAEIPVEKMNEITAELISKTCLVGWENFEDDFSKPVRWEALEEFLKSGKAKGVPDIKADFELAVADIGDDLPEVSPLICAQIMMDHGIDQAVVDQFIEKFVEVREVKFSPSKAYRYLTDPRFRDFREEVAEAVADRRNFALDWEAEKN